MRTILIAIMASALLYAGYLFYLRKKQEAEAAELAYIPVVRPESISTARFGAVAAQNAPLVVGTVIEPTVVNTGLWEELYNASPKGKQSRFQTVTVQTI